MIGVVLGAVGSLLVVPAASAADGGSTLQLAFDAWRPASADCSQRVTFRILPTSSRTPPTGAVLLLDGAKAELGRVDVLGFGAYTVTGRCAADNDHRRVTLRFEGDSTYAPQQVESPDECPRDLTTDPSTIDVFGYGNPVFMCRTTTAHNPRFADGRLVPSLGYSGAGGAIFLGDDVDIEYSIGDLAEFGGAPVAEVEEVLDGRVVRRLSSARVAEGVESMVETRTLAVGRHTWRVTYPGDPRWGPASTGYSFTVAKGRLSGTFATPGSTTLRRGQRPLVSLRLRNAFDRKAAAPTGKVDIFLESKRVKTLRLTNGDRGRARVRMPAIRRSGYYRLRFVYRGDRRYQRVDSAGGEWFGSRPTITVLRARRSSRL